MIPAQSTTSRLVEPQGLGAQSVAPDGRLTVVPSRGGDGLGVSVKVERTGRVFRIEPARDPRAPRFWCLRIYHGGAVVDADAAEAPWWGAGGMTRADLPAVIAAIRADPTAWLSHSARSGLREWMLGIDDASHA